MDFLKLVLACSFLLPFDAYSELHYCANAFRALPVRMLSPETLGAEVAALRARGAPIQESDKLLGHLVAVSIRVAEKFAPILGITHAAMDTEDLSQTILMELLRTFDRIDPTRLETARGFLMTTAYSVAKREIDAHQVGSRYERFHARKIKSAVAKIHPEPYADWKDEEITELIVKYLMNLKEHSSDHSSKPDLSELKKDYEYWAKRTIENYEEAKGSNDWRNPDNVFSENRSKAMVIKIYELFVSITSRPLYRPEFLPVTDLKEFHGARYDNSEVPEAAAFLRLELEHLPELERRMFHWLYVEGRTIPQIARGLGWERAKVKSKFFRMRSALRDIVELKGGLDKAP